MFVTEQNYNVLTGIYTMTILRRKFEKLSEYLTEKDMAMFWCQVCHICSFSLFIVYQSVERNLQKTSKTYVLYVYGCLVSSGVIL